MGAVFNLEGSGSGAVKAVEDLNKALDAMEKKADKAAVGTKKAEEAAKKLAAQADPQERYNQRMAKLAEAVHNGGLEIGKAETLAKRYGLAMENAGKAGDGAFAGRFIGQITAAASGMASLGAVVSQVQNHFANLEAVAQSAADRVFNAIASFGELQQLDTPTGQRALAAARELVKTGAVAPDNTAQAVEIASNMLNAGFSDAEIQFLVRDVAGSKLVAPANLDTVGGNLQKIKRQFGESDLQNVTGRILGAAGETQANLSVTSREVLKYAPLASATGATLDEALAAFVVAEQRSASPEAAAENLKSFFSQVYRRDLSDGDLQQTLANIKTKIGRGNAFDVLGDANAVIGYELLSKNVAELTEEERAIAASTFKVGSVVQADPPLRAAFLRSRSQGRLAADNERLSEVENLFAALRDEMNLRGRRVNESGIDYWLRNKQYDFADYTGQEAGFMKAEVENFRGKINPDVESAILDLLQRIETNTGNVDRTQRAKATTRQE